MFCFRSLRRPFARHSGSSWQKYCPGERKQNSYKSRLSFFSHQTFSMSTPLSVPWCPNLGLGENKIYCLGIPCKSFWKDLWWQEILPTIDFHTSTPSIQWVFELEGLIVNQHTVLPRNLPQTRISMRKMAIYNFLLSGLILLWSNVISHDPDARYAPQWDCMNFVDAFLPSRHSQLSFLWLSLGDPTWIIAARLWSWQARAKIA